MSTRTEASAAPAAPAGPRPSGAELAARYGLSQSGARPPLREYLVSLWGRRHFVLSFATARNTAQYTTNFLGQLWQVLTPLLNAGVYFLVFGLLLNTRRGVHNFIAYLVTGIFVFTYTQRSVLNGSKSITGNLSLVRALHFPRACLPLATTVMELQQVLVSMAVLFVIVLATGEPLTLQWLLLVPALALQTLFCLGMAMVFARLAARVPDLSQLLPFVLRTWMYVSGVFYAVKVFAKHAPESVRLLLEVNPAYVYIELVRDALMDSHQAYRYAWPLAVGWSLVAAVGGFVYFWRAEERYGRG